MENGTESEKKRRQAGRSPAYPVMPVDKAIEQARALYKQERDILAPLPSALAAWGYGPKSSGGRQTLATLKYYGLIDVTGEGDDRRIKVSDTARRIILDEREDDTERRQLIRTVALLPSAHKLMFKDYGSSLPSDGTVQYDLIHKHGFNPEAAKELLTEFKETARFISLYEPQQNVDKSKPEKQGDDPAKTPPAIKIGDKVQVTVGGVDMFEEAATVLGFAEDGGWVYIDKSDAAAKLDELTLVEAAAGNPPAEERPRVPEHLLKPKQETQPKGTRKAVFPLDEGDVALTFPEGLSSDGLAELGAYLDIFLKKEIKKTGQSQV